MSVKVPSLRQRLGNPIPPAEALRIAARICDALDALHARGAAHGDLRPETIQWDSAGAVTLGTAPPGDPAYQAPERRGTAVAADARSDVYSLGVVLYELLTRRLPPTPWQPPSPVAGTSLQIDKAIQNALEPDPARRPPGVKELRDAVEPPPPAAVPASGRNQRLRWIAAAALCVVVLPFMWSAGWKIKRGRLAAKLGHLEPEPGAARTVRLDRGRAVRVEDCELTYGDGCSVVDRHGTPSVRFTRLEPGQVRRWQDLELAIRTVSTDALEVAVAVRPGAASYGAGRYVNLRSGLRVELPGGRAVTVAAVDASKPELRITFERDGTSEERVLAAPADGIGLGVPYRFLRDEAGRPCLILDES